METGTLRFVSATEVWWTVKIFKIWLGLLTSGQKLLLTSPKFSVGNQEGYRLKLLLTGPVNIFEMVLFGPEQMGSADVHVTLRALEKYKLSVLNLGEIEATMNHRTTSVSQSFQFISTGFISFVIISCNIRQLPEVCVGEIAECVDEIAECVDEVAECVDIKTDVMNKSTKEGNHPQIEDDSAKYFELSQYFGLLFDNKKFSDVTVTVEGRRFNAHRVVLARSPVFSSMFEHEILGKGLSTIAIEDFSYKVILELLRYIYTCEIGELDQETMLELFVAADRYQMLDLKTKCSEALFKRMTPDTAIDVLIKADRYCDETLKEVAIHIILSDAIRIMKTEKWMTLLQTRPEMANGVLMRYVEETSR